MTTIVGDDVYEVSSTAGTGGIVLAGTVGSYRTFFAAFGLNVSFAYKIEDASISAWEIGRGHLFDATTLVRDTVINSTAGGSKVSFSDAVKRVYVMAPADMLNMIHEHEREQFTLGSLDVTNKYVTLGQAPLEDSVELEVQGAGIVLASLAYTVNAALKRVSWSGLSLDGLLSSGDKLSVSYARRF